jgi:acetolactate synthase I/II/III large subunit
MNGADALMQTLVNAGVTICFANPGTTEMHLVAAVDRTEGMRPVLGLFEGVVTGAADGWGRMTGKPAATLLHLGPGLANGLANLHNARRARTPILNLVGDHATYHVGLDAPLTSDIESLAQPMSIWVRTVKDAAGMAKDGAEAVAGALSPPGGPSTLIIPSDCAWSEASGLHAPVAPAPYEAVDSKVIDLTAQALKKARKPVLLLGSSAVTPEALEAAGRIAAATGARLMRDTFISRIGRGAGRVTPDVLSYFPELALDQLKEHDLMVIAGTRPPVAFFAYQKLPGSLVPAGCEPVTLAGPKADAPGALRALAEALGASGEPARQNLDKPGLASGNDLTPESVGQTIAALLPEGAIVSDEGTTCGIFTAIATTGAEAHEWLQLTGGSIGQGMPLAAGAALACPDRKVLCIHGDGGAMYTVQALWTMAREKLDVVNVIFSNRSYAILAMELMRADTGNAGPKALSMFDLANPELNWPKLAEGMGVSASRAETVSQFNRQLADAFRTKGPHLIEAVV